MPNPNLKFMIGSYGNADYLMIASRGKVALGIKPIHDGFAMGTFIGFRVRSAPYDIETPTDGNVATLQPSKGLDETWPSLKFTKHNHERASFMVGSVYPDTCNEAHAFLATYAAAPITSVLWPWLMQRLPDDAVMQATEDDVREFVAKFEEGAKEHAQSHAPDTMTDAAKVQKSQADLIAFMIKNPTGPYGIVMVPFAESVEALAAKAKASMATLGDGETTSASVVNFPGNHQPVTVSVTVETPASEKPIDPPPVPLADPAPVEPWDQPAQPDSGTSSGDSGSTDSSD